MGEGKLDSGGEGKASAELIRSGASSVTDWGSWFGFLLLAQGGRKQGQKLGELSIIHQVLAIWGWLSQKLGLTSWIVTREQFGFLQVWLAAVYLPGMCVVAKWLVSWVSCCWQWVKVLLLYVVWPLATSIFELSSLLKGYWQRNLEVSKLKRGTLCDWFGK